MISKIKEIIHRDFVAAKDNTMPYGILNNK